MEHAFPVFLKMIDGKSYYAIHSEEHMTQYQRLGTKWLVHELEAKIYPDRVLILDLLDKENDNLKRISKSEFELEVRKNLPE